MTKKEQKNHKGMEANGGPYQYKYPPVSIEGNKHWHLKFQQDTDSYVLFLYFIGQCNTHGYLQMSWGNTIAFPERGEQGLQSEETENKLSTHVFCKNLRICKILGAFKTH